MSLQKVAQFYLTHRNIDLYRPSSISKFHLSFSRKEYDIILILFSPFSEPSHLTLFLFCSQSSQKISFYCAYIYIVASTIIRERKQVKRQGQKITISFKDMYIRRWALVGLCMYVYTNQLHTHLIAAGGGEDAWGGGSELWMMNT